MKKLSLPKLINIFIILITATLVLISCKSETDNLVFEQTVEFNNDNWDFTQRTLEFTAPITDTISPYRIEMVLKYGPDDERVDMMRVSFSVTAPDGGKTSVPSAFVFSDEEGGSDMAKQAQQLSQSQTRVLYNKKYFNHSGDYHFRLNRHSEKFDNYNIHSLTLRIVRLEE
ncbi:MAG: hypothetical protein J5644_09655 [Bacteroidales bacterium]|nr:hypothetical protein [Bacteroidales bacterium]